MTYTFTRRCNLPVPAEEAFAWHSRPGAFERLLPPWENARLIRRRGGIEDGAETEIAVRIGPVPVRWRAVHFGYDQSKQFCDRQESGPFAFWEHRHLFHPGGASSCTLEDRIDYRPPLGTIGSLLGRGTVERKLDRMFRYRHAITRDDLADHSQYRDRRRLTIAITGGSGLVGSALAAYLSSGGHKVLRLRRTDARGDSKASADGPSWNPATGQLLGISEPLDALVHLAGESIASGRWTSAVKRRIRDSRVETTRRLAESLAQSASPPRALLCASASGYYGNRGDETLTESSPPGESFLSDVCRHWEAAAKPAAAAGIRVAQARFGIVLSPRSGALAKMLTPFQLGGGGPIGSGNQWWSWIALDDVLSALHHLLMNDSLSGPFNFSTPAPVTNRQFGKTLGRVLSRPSLMPLPATAARLALGEMADELLLASARLEPTRLLASGFRFRYPELEPALRHMLGR